MLLRIGSAFRVPLLLHHARQAVDHDVQKTADQQAQDAESYGIPKGGSQHRSDHLAELEDRQVHGDHDAADDGA